MEFREFTPESFEATAAHWKKLASKVSAFIPDVEQILEWTGDHLHVKENAIAYGVFRDEESVACGICELIVTKKSAKVGWVKLIRLRLDPEIDSQIFSNKPDGVVSAVEAYISCVLGLR